MAYDIDKLSTYQQEAQRLHDRYCKKIGKRIETYALKQAFKVGFYPQLADKRRADMWCPLCGKAIEQGTTECPHCHATLGSPRSYPNYERSGCRSYRDYFYFEEITTCRGWQISRMWLADFTFRKGKCVEMSYLGVVYERWFNPAIGKEVLLGKYRGSFPYYRRIPWAISCFDYTEVHVHRTLQRESYDESTALRYPNIRLLDWYRHSGMDGLLECARGNEYVTAFRMMLSPKSRQMTETMLKVGSKAEVGLMLSEPTEFAKYWRTILVARRHGFDYTLYGSEYFDYLHQLELLHIDLHSPHYVAPTDFRAMHQQMTGRLNAIAERERREAQRQREIREYERAKDKDESYRKARGMYFGLLIVSDTYKAEPLKSVAEFLDEGLAMDHCVFSGAYYDMGRHPDSLILSVKDNRTGQRAVTIEINIKNWKIQQCYAKHDNIHPQDKKIRKWINENMDIIKGFSKPSRRKAVAAA